MAGVTYKGFLPAADPRWKEDWSITVGPGSKYSSEPPSEPREAQPEEVSTSASAEVSASTRPPEPEAGSSPVHGGS